MNAIEMNNVSKAYKKFNLDNITLELPMGCIMGLIGKNGSGKSTIIELITGLVNSDEGEIYVLGTDNKSPEFVYTKQDIGLVLEHPCFPGRFTAKDINRIMWKIYRNWDENLFFEYLDKFGIDKKQRFGNYSRGMMAKLPIAIALSHKAKLLILDEATSGLDSAARDEILDIVNEFTRDEQNSVLMSSHILSDMDKICDYIVYVSNGKIKFCEEKDSFCDKYAVVKCRKEEFEKIDDRYVIGSTRSAFGVKAIVERSAITENMHVENARIEDIMIYMEKEEKP